jgi:hypothetical protein
MMAFELVDIRSLTQADCLGGWGDRNTMVLKSSVNYLLYYAGSDPSHSSVMYGKVQRGQK